MSTIEKRRHMEAQADALVERLIQYENWFLNDELAVGCKVCRIARNGRGHGWEADDCRANCILTTDAADCLGCVSDPGSPGRISVASYHRDDHHIPRAHRWYKEMIVRANDNLEAVNSNWRIKGMTKKQLGI